MKKLSLLFVLLSTLQLFCQEDAWVFLKDKPSSSTYLEAPLSILSQRALDRRARQNIALDSKDVPVHAPYYTQIKSTAGITVLAKSKWLNAIHVQGTQSAIAALSGTFSFVERVEFANNSLNAKQRVSQSSLDTNHRNKFSNLESEINYGDATTQIAMLRGDYLHQKGFTGAGMQIAVMDAGFPNVNVLNGFEGLIDNNQILGGYDFVNRSDVFYSGHNHGTNVLSDIGGSIDEVFIGTAPQASFYLFITEDVANEVPLEESLWVEAAEKADSLGVDVINTSLGYTTFDNANYNYSYDDMDGKTTFISRGAEIGASRGMILVNSAGNSGSNAWKYIGAPADAASVFSVGAVNENRDIAAFSSFGPTSDNRVKPDVLAHGQSVFVLDHVSGNPKTSNGTSFSSPIMAGVIACFWQAFPNLTNMEIMQRIRESADRYAVPDPQHGYGIPNFEFAYTTLFNELESKSLKEVSIYPNPVEDRFTLAYNGNDLHKLSIQIFNSIGMTVYENQSLNSTIVNISKLAAGVYVLKIKSGKQQKEIKLMKK